MVGGRSKGSSSRIGVEGRVETSEGKTAHKEMTSALCTLIDPFNSKNKYLHPQKSNGQRYKAVQTQAYGKVLG